MEKIIKKGIREDITFHKNGMRNIKILIWIVESSPKF